MNIFISKKRRGFAVIIALVAVTVLTLLAGAFAYSMKVETRLAQNSDSDEQLLWLGRAGVERARWILSLEPPGVSSLKQIWAGGSGEGPETNGPLAGISLDNFQVGEGTVSLKFVELESKININSPTTDKALLTQVLTAQGVDASEISVVSDSILDWIDPDDATRPAGAESDYYQGQVPPYYAKNAPIDDPSELLLIKGITLPMFKGGSAANDMGAAFQHHHLGFGNAPGQAPDYPFGLVDVFTQFSSGKINILTADANVLALIPGMDTAAVQALLTARDSDPPIRDVGRLLAAAGIVNQAAIGQIQNYVGTQGNTYEVHVTAHIGDYSREFVAVLFRNGPNVDVFSFYWK
jgi:general secretion pathway protein K